MGKNNPKIKISWNLLQNLHTVVNLQCWIRIWRSSHQRSIEICILKYFTKFTGKHLCQSLFFNKGADLRPAALLKKRLWHRCFPVSSAKYLRTLFYRTPLAASRIFFLSFHYSLLFKTINLRFASLINHMNKHALTLSM